jgi:predicted transposase YbfD/YdcC
MAVLLASLAAMVSGMSSQQAIAEWINQHDGCWRTALGLTHPQGPSQPTLHRLFASLDPVELESAFGAWSQAVLASTVETTVPSVWEAVAIDGKTLRGSRTSKDSVTHLLSACSHRLGIVLAQLQVRNKTNEIGAAPTLLKELLLDGVVITTDALLTQRSLAQQILDQQGAYFMVVKENQPQLLRDLTLLFDDHHAPVSAALTIDQHGRRIERRHLRASTELVGYSDWPGLAQAVCLERQVQDKGSGQVRRSTAYAVTSLEVEKASPQALLKLWRGHWNIENRLHYVRDVTYGEDRSRVRTAGAPQVMAALRNHAIGLLRLLGETNIAAGCRRHQFNPRLAFAAVGIYDNE